MTTVLRAALLVVLAATMASSQSPALVMAITNVTVIPMHAPRTLLDHTVIVRDGRIDVIAPSATVTVPQNAQRIEGRGKFLMPGIGDMHAHLPFGPSATERDIQRTHAMFAANGVTMIRNMEGAPAHLALRAAVSQGRVIGPRIHTSGPSLNGSIRTAADAASLVGRVKAEGYDFLKINPGVAADVFEAAISESKRLEISVSGHVPSAVGLRRALASGYRSIEHLDGYFQSALAPKDKSLLKAPGFFGVSLTDALDPGLLQEAVDATRRAGVWIVPTQTLLETFMSSESDLDLSRRDGMQYLPERLVDQWRRDRREFLSRPSFDQQLARRFIESRRKLLELLRQAGVPTALGTDAGQTFIVPGFSIHAEMASMVRSGMSPYDVYVAATREAARLIGREAETGTIELGKIADLVLLHADPLADVANFRRLTGVMFAGLWRDREALLGAAQALR